MLESTVTTLEQENDRQSRLLLISNSITTAQAIRIENLENQLKSQEAPLKKLEISLQGYEAGAKIQKAETQLLYGIITALSLVGLGEAVYIILQK